MVQKLYQHFMDYLGERGITEEFVGHLVVFATHYEHSQYVLLLENVNKIVSK